MNTIRRPRKRPRKSSVSFKTFGWLLVREGFIRIYYGQASPPIGQAGYYRITHEAAAILRRDAYSVLRRSPERRYYP